MGNILKCNLKYWDGCRSGIVSIFIPDIQLMALRRHWVLKSGIDSCRYNYKLTSPVTVLSFGRKAAVGTDVYGSPCIILQRCRNGDPVRWGSQK